MALLSVNVYPPINFWTPEPIFIKFGMYVLALEPISAAHFINPSHQSPCLYVYPLIVARQVLGKHVPAARNTRNSRIIVGRVVVYAVRVVSKKNLWVWACIPLSLLGNGLVNTIPRQRRIVGGVSFYAVRFVSKESRRLILARTWT
jgi:hypothetical protein